MTGPDQTFWKQFSNRKTKIESAIQNEDSNSLSQLADELADFLAEFDERLNLNIYGPEPFRLGILPLPGAEAIATSFVDSSQSPEGWEVAVGLPEFDELESVIVEDESGNSLTVEYSRMTATVHLQKDESAIIKVSISEDFENNGPTAHLYQFAAESVVDNLLGGFPPELSEVKLLPQSKAGKLQPLNTLRQQWIECFPN